MSNLHAVERTIVASGAAQVVVGPVPPGVRWRVNSVAVRLDDGATGTARLYDGTVQPSQQVTATAQGADDVSTGDGLVLDVGRILTVTWEDVTADGVVATATVRGSIEQTGI